MCPLLKATLFFLPNADKIVILFKNITANKNGKGSGLESGKKSTNKDTFKP
jgi:hypothetical protein